MKRIPVAAVAGGLIVFVWSAIAHMATPLGTAGLSTLANEAPVAEAIQTTVPRPGMYMLPGRDLSHQPTAEEEQAWLQKIERGPTAMLVVSSLAHGEAISARRLVSELLTNILAAAIAAWIVSLMPGPFVRRTLAIVAMAVFASVSLTFSYWIWDGFPAAFVLGELTTETIGWLIAGLAIARLVPPASAHL